MPHDFRDRLEQIRQEADQQRKQQSAEASARRQRERERDELVDTAAQATEVHIEQRLREFNEQFVEFRFGAFNEKGRHLQLSWDDPGGAQRRARLHQLVFRVRRYHEFADVEVEVKMIIGNSQKNRRAREEDVFDGNPEALKGFVDEQIFRFTRLYLDERGW